MAQDLSISFLVTLFLIIGIFISANIAQNGGLYTPDELERSQKLREILGNELLEDYMKKDAWLVPWLRAKNMDLKAATEMVRKSMEWRRIHRMNGILRETFPKLQKIYPYWMDGYDIDGRPVVELPLGQWDVRRATLAGAKAELTRYMFQMLERGAHWIRDTATIRGNNITQLELIMDVNGYNIKTHGCLACFPVYIEFLSTYEANYPQMARNITLINCPRISESLLTLLKSLLTPASSNAIKFYGYNKGEWKDDLTHHINPNQLSPEFGGTKVRNSGYFQGQSSTTEGLN